MNKLEILETIEGFIAIFTGTTGGGEEVIKEEAHNIKGETKKEREIISLMVWGAESTNTEIYHV